MNAKITKDRLRIMLSYDWFKIILAIGALIVGWMLVFNMTATKVVSSQRFVVCNYYSNASLEGKMYTALDEQLLDKKLTHEILEVDCIDLAIGDTSAAEVLYTYASVNELDVIYVLQDPDPSTAYAGQDENGKDVTLYESTYLETFTNGYGWALHNLSLTDEDGYFKSLERYLNRYYTNGYEDDSVLDTAKIEEDFRARAKGDKRYKREKQIQKGIQGDIERIQKYRKALLDFYDWNAAGRVKIENIPFIQEDGSDLWQGKGNFAVNICTTKEDSVRLSRYVSNQTGTSALNMSVCFFDSNGEEESHRYEALVYLTNFLATVYA